MQPGRSRQHAGSEPLDSGAGRLAACYREVLDTGEQLLQLFGDEPSDQAQDLAERLMDLRDRLAAEADRLISQGWRSEAALALLRQVADQQRQLESVLAQRLGRTRQAAASRTQAREQMQGFQRFLGQGRASTLLNQRK